MAAIGTGWVDGAWVEASWVSGAWSQAALEAPVFSGTILDIEGTEGDPDIVNDYSSHFTNPTSYSIAPAVEAGWDFDTGTGILTVDTDAIGIFGPYIITGTNAAGSDDSNEFSVEILESGAGGTPNRLKRKRENLEDLRRAAQSAILRRRHAEELEAKVQRQLERAVPAGATIEYDAQAMRIASITEKLDREIAIEFEAKARADEEEMQAEATRKRRKRDQIAVMLLLH